MIYHSGTKTDKNGKNELGEMGRNGEASGKNPRAPGGDYSDLERYTGPFIEDKSLRYAFVAFSLVSPFKLSISSSKISISNFIASSSFLLTNNHPSVRVSA
jgi:hypothetical protein